MLQPTGFLEEIISANSYLLVGFASFALLILTLVSLKTKKLTAVGKKILFSSIVLVVLLPTVYMAYSTIYLNVISQSGGPVHWHADIEIWNCGSELELKDPTGLSNKIGTPTFHEHNDKRLHVEGVIVNEGDVSLGRFFTVIGGQLTSTSLTVPTNTGAVTLANGNACPNGQAGEVQAFVYKTDTDGYYHQEKLISPEKYQLSPQAQVPAGDCIIVDYGPSMARTDKLCRSYKVAEQIGKLKGERN